MLEYTVETLVHLYDSLNAQVLSAVDQLTEAEQICVCLEDPHKEDFMRARQRLEDRVDKLTKMRDNVEILLERFIEAEVAE